MMHIWRIYRRLVAFVWALSLGLGMVTLTLRSAETAVPFSPLLAQNVERNSYAVSREPSDHVVINEVRVDQTGTDNDEYFELAGSPGTSLSDLTYLVIGDGAGGSGVIEAVIPLAGIVPARGYFLVVEATFSLTSTADLTTSLNFENTDNVTHLLVSDFSGSNGQDLDTNDDGVLDITPWTAVHDLIALIREENPPTTTEYHYGPPTVGPGGSSWPGHAFHCPEQWEMGNFDAGVNDTPGAANICPIADLSADKSGPTFTQVGGVIQYTLSYANGGTAVAANTLLSDTLPAGLTYLNDTSGLLCTGCLPGSNQMVWELDSLTPGDSSNFVLTALVSDSVPYGSVLTNTAVITTTSPENNLNNNQAQWMTTVSPLDLAVTATGPAVNFAGEPLVYTITVQTIGIATATQVVLTDVIPLQTSYVADSAPWPVTVAGQTITWQAGNLPPGLQTSFQLTVTAVPSIPNGTIATNLVTAVTSAPGDDPANNSAQTSATLYTLVPIAQARAGNSGDLFAIEGQIIYQPGTYNVNGWGVQDDSGGIGVFYAPPPLLQLGDTVRLVATRGSFQNEEQLNAPVHYFANLGPGPEVPSLPFSTGQIADGSSEGWLAIISGTVSGRYCPTQFYLDDGTGAALVYVDADTGIDVCGGGLRNGMTAVVTGYSTQFQDEYEIKPRRPADVQFVGNAPSLSKAAPVLVGPGQLFTYTLTVFNNLGYTLTNVIIADAVPVLADFAYALDGGSYADGVVSWTRPSLPHQSSATVRFAVNAPPETAVVENHDYTLTAANFVTPTIGPPVFTMVISGPVAIHHIQGARHSSLLAGEVVTGVQGVVTAVSGSGFFLQDPQPDEDEATSEGIFVYTANTPSVSVGDLISVTGLVDEFTSDGLGSGNLSTTQLRNVSIDTLATNQPLPVPVVVGINGRVPPNQIIDNDANGDVNQTPNFDPAEDGIDFYESLEGMLVQVNGAVVVGTTFFNEVIVVGDSGANGGLFSSRGALVVRDDDFNPERIFIDDTLVPTPANYQIGDAFTAPITGVLDYSFGNFKLLNVNPLPPVMPGGLVAETTPLSSAPDRLTIATFNVENLSAQSDPARVEALAAIIVDNLGAPDILALVEVQDNNGAADNGVVDASETYQLLLGAIVDAGGPLYDFQDIPPEDNQDGGQPGGNIRVGFIFQPERVMFVDRAGGTAVASTTVTMGSLGVELSYSPGRIAPQHPAFDNSRKPLAAEFLFNGYKLILIANHFNSKGGDGPLFGRHQPPLLVTEAKRVAQAQVVADFVQQIVDLDEQAHVVVLGDLNDFPFAPPLLALEESGLNNLITWLPEAERYTYIYQGNAQVLDHVLVSEGLAAHTAVTADIVHVNSEFRLDAQASDHDPVIAQFTMPPLAATFSSNSPVRLGELSTFNNTSVGATAYLWDFGDGVGMSTAVNPSYAYMAEGTYTVTLTASNELGQVVFMADHIVGPPYYHVYLPLVVKPATAVNRHPITDHRLRITGYGLLFHHQLLRFFFQVPRQQPQPLPLLAKNINDSQGTQVTNVAIRRISQLFKDGHSRGVRSPCFHKLFG